MPRQYPAELRRQICERMLEGEPVKNLREEFQISEYTLYRWRRQARVDADQRPGVKSFTPNEFEDLHSTHTQATLS